MKINRPAKWCCALTFLALVVTFAVNWHPSEAQEKKDEAKTTEAAPAAEKTATKEEAKTEGATTAAPSTETKTEEAKPPVVLPPYMTQTSPDPKKPLCPVTGPLPHPVPWETATRQR